MNGISYTFPDQAAIPAPIRGKTFTGGRLIRHMSGGSPIDVILFAERINGETVAAKVAGKPELEAAVAAIRKAKKAETDAAIEQHRLYLQTLPGQREALVIAEENSYSPNHHPGSNAWHKNAAAANALRAFDSTHPEIVAGIKVLRSAKIQAEWDALSDFVKNGS